MPVCVVKLCKNNTTRNKKESGITHHLFPTDLVMCERWAAIIRLSREQSWWKPGRHSVICSAHFNESDFYLTKGGLKRLCKGAVPQNALFLSSTLPDKFVQNSDYAGKSEFEEDIPEGRELVVRVYRYLQTEYEQLKQFTGNSFDLSPLANILKRTAAATGLTEQTITLILDKAGSDCGEGASDDAAPAKRMKLDLKLEDDVEKEGEHKQQEQVDCIIQQRMEQNVYVKEERLQQEQNDYVPEERLQQEQNDYVPEERLQQEQNDYVPEERLQQEQNVYIPEERLQQEQNVYIPEERLQQEQNVYIPEERLQQEQNVYIPEERLQQEQNVYIPEERLQQEQNVYIPETLKIEYEDDDYDSLASHGTPDTTLVTLKRGFVEPDADVTDPLHISCDSLAHKTPDNAHVMIKLEPDDDGIRSPRVQ